MGRQRESSKSCKHKYYIQPYIYMQNVLCNCNCSIPSSHYARLQHNNCIATAAITTTPPFYILLSLSIQTWHMKGTIEKDICFLLFFLIFTYFLSGSIKIPKRENMWICMSERVQKGERIKI